jgi:hypothetical protein
MTGNDLSQCFQESMTKAEATIERPVPPSGAKGLNRRGFMLALVGASGTMLVGCVDLGNPGLGLKLASLAVDDNTTRPIASAGGRADSRGARRRGSLRPAADRQEEPSRPARRRRRTRDRDD